MVAESTDRNLIVAIFLRGYEIYNLLSLNFCKRLLIHESKKDHPLRVMCHPVYT
jgi:hypothetical protein